MADDIINYIKNLIFQGKTREEAIDHALHYFGKSRAEIMTIIGRTAKT